MTNANVKTGDHRFEAWMRRDSTTTFPDKDINHPVEVYGPWQVEVEEIVIGRVTSSRVMYGYAAGDDNGHRWMDPGAVGAYSATREEAISRMKAGYRAKVEAAREAVKHAEEIAAAAEVAS